AGAGWGADTGGGRKLHGFALFSVLGALMLTLLLEALDQTIVGTARPKIIGDLNGFSLYTWVATAYILASATVIPIVGKLSDLYGRKGFFLVGVALFLIGSALSGLSQTIEQLIAFRALQGLGAGVGIALVFTVVGDIFPPLERARWQGLFGAVYALSSIIGPFLGGFLTDNLSWRSVFYVNLPVGFFALVGIVLFLPANISPRNATFSGWAAIRRIDLLGAVLAAGATISLLLGLTFAGQGSAWTSTEVVGWLAAGILLVAAFLVRERFAADPLLPLGLFRNQVFSSVAVLSLGVGAVILSLAYYLPLFLQGVLGESATNSGAVLTPLLIANVIAGSMSGFIVARSGKYQRLAIGAAVVMNVGTFLLSQMTQSTSLTEAALFMVITGLGFGIFFTIPTLAVQNAVPYTQMGVVTGTARYFQQVGATLGIAVVGSVVANGISSDINGHLPAGASQLPAAALSAATNPQVLTNPAYHDQVVANAVKYGGPAAQGTLDQIFIALKHSLAVGIGEGMVVVLGFSLVMLAATLFLKNVPLRSGWGPATESAAGSAGGSSGGSEWGQAPSGATPGAAGAASWGQGSGTAPSGGANWNPGSTDGGRPEPGAARRT
ncbi:MAG: MDR family MFS transporter, partial [Candidatus Limnocylindrales bacterium]